MSFRKSTLLTISLIFAPITLSACQVKTLPLTQTCSEIDYSARCLLNYAQAELETIEEKYVWISAASELAIAYDVIGNQSKSHQLITEAISKSSEISDKSARGKALTEVLTAINELSKTKQADVWAKNLILYMDDLEARARAEIGGKLTVLEAVHKDTNSGFQSALSLPESQTVEGYAKAISLRKIAGLLAKDSDFKNARQAIDSITMSIDYYKSMARSDVARIAYNKGNKVFADELLSEADLIARSLENGYFSGAALRDIGYSYAQMGMVEISSNYFRDALNEARNADKQNEKARATSRIATRFSDAGLEKQTPSILNKAADLANLIETDRMKFYSYYEISGAAGITGQYDLARKWLSEVPEIEMGSTSSIKAAAQRDLAWGLARYGNVDEALKVVKQIKSPREKLHAISRIVRVQENPKMEALPRYL